MPKKPVLKVMTLGQLNKAAAALEKKLAKQIVLDEKNATCTINITYPYEVDLDRIANERDLLAWAFHLIKKSWMRPQHLAFFIKIVAKYKGFNLRLSRMDHSRN